MDQIQIVNRPKKELEESFYNYNECHNFKNEQNSKNSVLHWKYIWLGASSKKDKEKWRECNSVTSVTSTDTYPHTHLLDLFFQHLCKYQL